MAPDINLLRAVARENLSRALRLKRGKKILIIDHKLTSTLDLIANFKFLQDLGVEKVYQLEKCGPPSPLESSGVHQCLYLIRSDLISARFICDQINSNLNRGVKMTYAVVLVPRLLSVISTLFESEGVYEHLTLGQYSHDLIPLEDHLLSLELDQLPLQLWLDHDTSLLASIAKSLFNLKGIYGSWSHLVAIGQHSQTVLRMMSEFERIYGQKAHHRQESDIPTVFIIDRDVDWVTPLMIPLNYEAVLDEMFGIKGRSLSLDSEITGKDNFKHNVTQDKVFERVRGLHFSQVISYLLAQEKECRRMQDGSAGLNLQQMKKFVAQDLQKIQALKKLLVLHFGAFEAILKSKKVNLKKMVDLQDNIVEGVDSKGTQEWLEDAMARGMDPQRILRLFCLATLAQDGLRDAGNLKRQFVQSYGFKHLITLGNLERMGLLWGYRGIEVNAKGIGQVVGKVTGLASPGEAKVKVQKDQGVMAHHVLKKLAPPGNVMVDLSTANHSSYVFNGKFSPFVSRVVEEVLSTLVSPKMNGKLAEKKVEDWLKGFQLPERWTSVKFRNTAEAYGRGRNCLVFVLGGISRGEVAALQVVGRNLGFNVICGGTDVLSGQKLMNLVMEK